VRLIMALAESGCSVNVVCPADHPVTKTHAAERIFDYHGLAPLSSLAHAISSVKPELIIPGDDLATQHLHSLHQRGLRRGKAGKAICQLIERSLGSPESFAIVYGRTAVMELAGSEGIRVPETKVISNTDDLRRWTARIGFPFVLKADRTSGGTGVKIVHTPEEAEAAFRKLHAAPRFRHAIRQAWVAHDTTVFWPSLLRQRRTINAQAFIAGREATSTVLCWQGSVLASLHFEVLHTAYSSGPATVVKLIQNTEMQEAAEKIIGRLNLSGFQGFDFVFDGSTGNPYLIEMNPRVTQAGHLTLGAGRDIPAALYGTLTGELVRPAPILTDNDTIAYFPQEWLRDPASSFLKSAYHDVPWDEPDLVRACVGPRAAPVILDSRRKVIPALSTVGIPPA
jgi:hypothetical protein